MNLDFTRANVLIVGDVMLDSYWQGNTDRISPEAPVPVVHVNDLSWRVGGAGNVAVNVTSLGGQASLLALIGDDAEGIRLQQLLEQSDINNHCIIDPTIPTINKLRVLSQHQQLIRLDFEETLTNIDLAPILSRYHSLLTNVGVVILSDYGKGLLKDIRPFIETAQQSAIPVFIDPKKKDFASYQGATLLTPNRKEFELAVGKWDSPQMLESMARHVLDQHNIKGMLVTQGGDGMTLIMNDHPTRHFPAIAKDVYDVTGAGDTVIASLATSFSSGMDIEDAVSLACKAAAIVVGRVGTSSVTVEDLHDFDRSTSHKLSPIKDKVVSQTDLLSLVERYKQSGKKVVFTNGCFDLLHAGHVNYLEKAAELGDVLIVAVNSDESVRGLKGDNRPLNTLKDRMTVLASLASVDLVVDFSESTPEQLICRLKPDVLVKGGDYQVDEIAGRDCVREVILIDLTEGKSTSSLVNQIQNL